MTIETPDRLQTARILWIDDQISAFGPHIEDLEDSGFEVIAVATADEALSTVRRGDHFDANLVDLKMPDSDGIALLAQLCAEVRDLESTKIVVLSSFLYDPIVRRRLVDLNMNVALLEKTRGPADGPAVSFVQRVEDVLSRKDAAPSTRDQFTTWDQTADSLDPFEISFESYRDSPMVVRLQLDLRAQAATKAIRAELAERGVVWSLFCGSSEEPLETATELSEIPSDEQIFSLASGKGHPPYEFYERGEFEELTGTGLSETTADAEGCPGAPDYPFFRIGVVHHLEDDLSITRARDFHFDSGLDVTAFHLEAALKLGLDVDSDKPAKFVQYGPRSHAFYTVSGDAFVERGNRGSLQVRISGRAYAEWAASPFSRRCADFGCSEGELCYRRHALLGRNLLVENEMQLDLRRM
jgi:CheY-like chemotaxis protein